MYIHKIVVRRLGSMHGHLNRRFEIEHGLTTDGLLIVDGHQRTVKGESRNQQLLRCDHGKPTFDDTVADNLTRHIRRQRRVFIFHKLYLAQLGLLDMHQGGLQAVEFSLQLVRLQLKAAVHLCQSLIPPGLCFIRLFQCFILLSQRVIGSFASVHPGKIIG